MSNTALRARVVLNEMEAMGLTIDDLLAVAGGEQRATAGPTVAEYVRLVAARTSLGHDAPTTRTGR